MAETPLPSGHRQGLRLAKSTIVGGAFAKKSTQNNENHLWTGAAITNLEKGPVPSPHTEPQNSYVSYVEFQRGNVRSSKVTKRTWLMNTLALLRKVDPHVMILPYEISSKINAISYPAHIPQTNDQLILYFPRMHMQSGHMTAKCKIRSSIPINTIKWKIMPQLENLNYYIQPTQLKALRTGKAGWFLGAHSDLTYRTEFESVLKPIVYQKFDKHLEFQIIPEIEKITVGSKTVKQRVLVLRCDLQEVENFRAFFSEIFSPGSTIDIGYLMRYTFITSHPVGSCTKQHLQAILKNQQEFHRNVHYYIMYGIHNLNTQYPTLPNGELQQALQGVSNPIVNTPTSPENTPLTQDEETMKESGSIPIQETAENTPMPDANSTDEQGDQDQFDATGKQSKETGNASKLQAISLRYLMYLSIAENGTSLFHAVYPSSEEGKIYCLCTQENRDEALTLLHNLEETSITYFQESHVKQIFVGHRNQPPYVKDYPKITNHYNTYASNLVNLVATSDNPQEDTFSPEAANDPPVYVKQKSYQQAVSELPTSPTKRQRHSDNLPLRSNHSTSRLPTGFDDNVQMNEKLNATVNETIARMKNLEQATHSHEHHLGSVHSTLEMHGNDIARMGQAVDSNSKSITKLLEAHSLQQRTIEKIDEKQSSMQSDMSEVLEFTREFTKQFAETPNGNRGAQS